MLVVTPRGFRQRCLHSSANVRRPPQSTLRLRRKTIVATRPSKVEAIEWLEMEERSARCPILVVPAEAPLLPNGFGQTRREPVQAYCI